MNNSLGLKDKLRGRWNFILTLFHPIHSLSCLRLTGTYITYRVRDNTWQHLKQNWRRHPASFQWFFFLWKMHYQFLNLKWDAPVNALWDGHEMSLEKAKKCQFSTLNHVKILINVFYLFPLTIFYGDGTFGFHKGLYSAKNTNSLSKGVSFYFLWRGYIVISSCTQYPRASSHWCFEKCEQIKNVRSYRPCHPILGVLKRTHSQK